MPTGIVKWFNANRGYGFIAPASGGDDVFAHYSAIVMEGYRTLEPGQRVEFGVIDGPHGPEATRITRLNLDAQRSVGEGRGYAAPTARPTE